MSGTVSLVDEMYGTLKESFLDKNMFTVDVIERSRSRVQAYTSQDGIKLGFRNLVLSFDNSTVGIFSLMDDWNLSTMIEEDEDFMNKLTEIWRLYSL